MMEKIMRLPASRIGILFNPTDEEVVKSTLSSKGELPCKQRYQIIFYFDSLRGNSIGTNLNNIILLLHQLLTLITVFFIAN